jgi:hypothetical protein
MPLQTVAATGVAGRVELEPTLAPAIRDLATCHRVVLLSFVVERERAGVAAAGSRLGA